MCGLKRDIAAGKYTLKQVTPFVGVWIETVIPILWYDDIRVTPFVGVWIETIDMATTYGYAPSHPSWVCGLKLSTL